MRLRSPNPPEARASTFDGAADYAVLNASGSSKEVQENLARSLMEDAGVVLTTANTTIAELVQDWSTPQGSELVELLATVPKTAQQAA